MRVPKTLIVVAGTVGIISGSLWAIEPHLPNQAPLTPEQVQQQQQERQQGDLSDSNDNNNDAKNDSGDDHRKAENDRKLGNHEPRPKIKIRLP